MHQNKKNIHGVVFTLSLTLLFAAITSCEFHHKPEPFSSKFSSTLEKELSLSPEQVRQLDIIVKETEKEAYAFHKNHKLKKQPVMGFTALRLKIFGDRISQILNRKQRERFLILQYNFERKTIDIVRTIIFSSLTLILIIIGLLIFFNKRLKKKVFRRTRELNDVNMELEDKSDRLQDLNRTLEERVEERTEEIHQKNLLLEEWNVMMRKELDMARSIQEQLIPESAPADYIATLYKPMDQVGGDFYDFIKFKDSDKIGIFISDVSGHGVPAAFITSMIKSVLLQSSDIWNDPASLLTRMNAVLMDNIAGNFFTALYGIYDPDTREFLFASAGHNSPYRITQKETSELQGGRSVPVGFMDNSFLTQSGKNYRNEKTILEQGSKLLLYTDGLVEAEPENSRYTFYEENGLLDILQTNRDASPNEFISRLYSGLVAFRGSEIFEDDVCLICLDVV